jgi:antitoxin component of RelBE/YafQ-DinJ toxin-antitoxin module
MGITKTAHIMVRLTEPQKKQLEAVAEEAGMNVSEYVRHLILKALGIVK